jgi:NADH dehydrogenase FAD-containing subunit
VVRAGEHTLTIEHKGTETQIETAAVVWVAGVRVNPLIEHLEIEKDRADCWWFMPTLQIPGHENVIRARR